MAYIYASMLPGTIMTSIETQNYFAHTRVYSKIRKLCTHGMNVTFAAAERIIHDGLLCRWSPVMNISSVVIHDSFKVTGDAHSFAIFGVSGMNFRRFDLDLRCLIFPAWYCSVSCRFLLDPSLHRLLGLFAAIWAILKDAFVDLKLSG